MTPERPLRLVALRALVALSWMALIYVLSDQPQLPSVPAGWLDWAIKKGLHAAGYAVLARLWHRTLTTARVRRAAHWSLAIAALYAAGDEWHQTFVPGRHGHAADVAIDVAGAAAALAWLALSTKERDR